MIMMSTKSRPWYYLALVLATLIATQPASATDLILYNGNVITVDEENSRANAIAISDGLIAAVGGDEAILALAGEGTKTIDLGGKTVIPGIVDAHTHLRGVAGNVGMLQITHADSVNQVLQIIREHATTVPEGQWIQTATGWQPTNFAEKRMPTRLELDDAAPQHPVFVKKGYQSAVVNSLALEMAGIDEESAGDQFLRDDSGILTGEINGSLNPVSDAQPAQSDTDVTRSYIEAMKVVNALGMTSLRDAALGPPQVALLRNLSEQGRLTVRINAVGQIYPPTPLQVDQRMWGHVPITRGDWFIHDTLKIVADGGINDALLSEEYSWTEDGKPGFKGRYVTSMDKIKAVSAWACETRRKLAVHTIGDAMIDAMLDHYESIVADCPVGELGWTLEHVALIRADQVERLNKLGLSVTTQTGLNYNLAAAWRKLWGEDRMARSVPNRMLIDMGVQPGGGTDASTGPLNPFVAMWADVTRQTRDGLIGPEQAVSPEESLRMHTIWAAQVLGTSVNTGSIEVGKFADLAVIDRDILSIPHDEIRGTRVEMTLVNGEVVIHPHADSVLHNGKIVTVDDQFSIRQAVAIKDGKILQTGDSDEVLALAGQLTEVIDLEGQMVLPGFVDGHPHMVHRGSGLLTTLDLNGVESIEEVKGRVAKKVATLEPGEWIQATWLRGQPFAALPGALEEGRFPTRWDLDEVAPDNPVYIPTPFSYPLPSIFNSAALRVLEIPDDAPEDFGGAVLVKDPDSGIPNGQVHKIVIFNYACSLCRKLGDLLPNPPFETQVAGVKEQIRRNNAVGITSVYEGHHMLNGQAELVKALLDNGELDMRIHIAYQVTGQQWMTLPALDAWLGEISGKPTVGGYEGAADLESTGGSSGWSGKTAADKKPTGGWSGKKPEESGSGSRVGSSSDGGQSSWSGAGSADKPKMLRIEDDTDMVVMGGVTLGMGGGPVNMGMALMHEPYNDAFGNRVINKTPKDLQKAKDTALLATRHGLRVNFGTGDEMGPDLILDIYDHVNQQIPIKDKRFVIMHIPYARPESIHRAKDLGVAITTSNNFEYDEYWLGMEDFERAFGDRAEYYSSIFVPWKWWLDAGVPAALGSDNKEPIPLFTIWHAMTRQGRSGASNMTDSKRISREDAIRIQTINGAKLLNWEHKIGSLEEGKLADLVILDTNILESEIEEIKDAKVLMTIIGGRTVYKAGNQGNR